MRSAATIEAFEAHTNVKSTEASRSTSTIAIKPQAQPLSKDEGAKFNGLVDSLIPCRNEDPELWFAEQAPQMAEAKVLCGSCPLATACLQGAIDREEPWGVWGGEIIVDGKIVTQKRGRGRPRKAEAA